MNATDLGLTDDTAILAEARATATCHLGIQAVSEEECPIQGMASRTVEVIMADGIHVIIQLRREPVHEENAQQGHDILGNIVPVPIRVIQDECPISYTYIMPLIPGSTWLAKDTTHWPSKYNVKLAGQIGNIIGRCCKAFGDKIDKIDSFIIPRLQRYMEWDEPTIAPYKVLIRNLLSQIDNLRRLPLCLTHWDINMMNIMVTDDAEITGLLDWEETYWMPFGMNTHIISRLAGYNQRGVYSKRTYSADMEISFWRELFLSAPMGVRGFLPEIQLAKDIGYVMSTFHDASAPPHPSHIGVFNDALGYKVPELSHLVLGLYLPD
jgi:hypothetical protein